jgi:hypothetical protein
MLEINEQNHTSVLISSLNKIYNQSKLKGKLNSINLYFLNIIFNLLNNCCIELSNKEKKQLMNVYRKLYFNSENICNVENVLKYKIEPKITFTQAETKDCNQYNEGINKKIYYWKESVGSSTTFEDIVLICKNLSYVTTHNNNTFQEFNNGVEIDYLNPTTKCICFNLHGVTINDNYKLYDENDVNITNLYDSQYIPETNSLIFVSLSYTITHNEIKIKKV